MHDPDTNSDTNNEDEEPRLIQGNAMAALKYDIETCQVFGIGHPSGTDENIQASYSDNDCAKCGDEADGEVEYYYQDTLADGETVYYCQDCAEYMHERYRIDAVVGGDIDLDLNETSVDPESAVPCTDIQERYMTEADRRASQQK